MTAATAAKSTAQANRGTIFVEDALLTCIREYPGQQFVLRLAAENCAQRARAGSFVHIRCDDGIPMRRPLSIMRTSAEAGWIELLFKITGDGLQALGRQQVGATLSIVGPIGRGFAPNPKRPRVLMIGGGVGIPPLIFLAEQLLRDDVAWTPTVLMGSELPFPFELSRSELPTEWLPPGIVSSIALLESRGIPARLASLSGFAGCFEGYVTDLARTCLDAQSAAALAQTEIFSCGPTPMLQAVARLASEFRLPCQVALEEFMACAVGGCAGCTVLVQTEQGPAMKRVCVDGPVFEASAVFPDDAAVAGAGKAR